MEVICETINIDITQKKLKELIFISNALENGWTIKKRNNLYVFSKKHNNKKEVYDNQYLQEFISDNSIIHKKMLELRNVFN